MVEYIEREASIKGMWDGLKDGSICGPEDTEEYLRKLPAADVVPAGEAETLRSEIERLKAEVERLHKENFWLTGHREGEPDGTAQI